MRAPMAKILNAPRFGVEASPASFHSAKAMQSLSPPHSPGRAIALCRAGPSFCGTHVRACQSALLQKPTQDATHGLNGPIRCHGAAWTCLQIDCCLTDGPGSLLKAAGWMTGPFLVPWILFFHILFSGEQHSQTATLVLTCSFWAAGSHRGGDHPVLFCVFVLSCALLCFALLCFALLCFAWLLCSALLCSALV
ncbi:hypothetical protein V8C37DRAFT_394253 [Trichoderma ceciliae]